MRCARRWTPRCPPGSTSCEVVAAAAGRPSARRRGSRHRSGGSSCPSVAPDVGAAALATFLALDERPGRAGDQGRHPPRWTPGRRSSRRGRRSRCGQRSRWGRPPRLNGGVCDTGRGRSAPNTRCSTRRHLDGAATRSRTVDARHPRGDAAGAGPARRGAARGPLGIWWIRSDQRIDHLLRVLGAVATDFFDLAPRGAPRLHRRRTPRERTGEHVLDNERNSDTPQRIERPRRATRPARPAPPARRPADQPARRPLAEDGTAARQRLHAGCRRRQAGGTREADPQEGSRRGTPSRRRGAPRLPPTRRPAAEADPQRLRRDSRGRVPSRRRPSSAPAREPRSRSAPAGRGRHRAASALPSSRPTAPMAMTDGGSSTAQTTASADGADDGDGPPRSGTARAAVAVVVAVVAAAGERRAGGEDVD